jgi:HSP20 family protein
MPIKKYRKENEPFGLLANFRDEVDRLFDDFFAPWKRKRLLPTEAVWSPELDVYEDENNVMVSADLPGMKPEEIDISVSGNTLKISGEKKKKEEKKGRNYYRLEKSYGSFFRRVELPAAIDAGKISATYKDGVLEVTLPKTGKTKPKKVKIQVK